MNSIDKAHRSLERPKFTRYQEETSSDIWKGILLIGLYVLGFLLVIWCFAIRDASAQEIPDIITIRLSNLEGRSVISYLDTESLPVDASITTESPDVFKFDTPTMHEVGSVFSGSSGTETPEGIYRVGLPMPPYEDYLNFSAEKVAGIKAGQLENMLRLGLLPADTDLRMFTSRRSAQADLELYSVTISLHQRALAEGKDVNWYIDNIINGKLDFPRIKRDVEVCGVKFALYPNSSKCSRFPTHEIAERHYDASVDTLTEKDKEIGGLKALLASKDAEILVLKNTIKKLSKKKGKR